MPVQLELKFKDGTSQNLNLPVEIWKRNIEWTFEVPSTKEITSVQLDPKGSLPDANVSDNIFKVGNQVVDVINVKDFIGRFVSKQLPFKIEMKADGNNLTAQGEGQPAFPLEYEGADKFVFSGADVEIQFSKDKKSFTLSQGAQKFDFTKE